MKNRHMIRNDTCETLALGDEWCSVVISQGVGTPRRYLSPIVWPAHRERYFKKMNLD
jgi:hypothetical protein